MGKWNKRLKKLFRINRGDNNKNIAKVNNQLDKNGDTQSVDSTNDLGQYFNTYNFEEHQNRSMNKASAIFVESEILPDRAIGVPSLEKDELVKLDLDSVNKKLNESIKKIAIKNEKKWENL